MDFYEIKPHELKFKYNPQMDYADNLYVFLKMLPDYGEIRIRVFSSEPEKFIETVKELIDYWGVRDIEFTNDYSKVRKIAPPDKYITKKKYYPFYDSKNGKNDR